MSFEGVKFHAWYSELELGESADMMVVDELGGI